MKFNKALSSNVWKFYVITALGIRFIAPIRILYLISYGLTFAQIGMMELAAAIAIVVLEIPTGIFADIVGRKTSRLIAYILSITAFSFMSFGSSLPVFIFGWTLSGAADAFQSGAHDALIFDTLKQLGRERDYIKIKSHFVLINTTSVIIGSLLGAYFYAINPRLPWYLITLTIILSTLIFLTVKEPEFQSRHVKIKDKLVQFRNSLQKSLSLARVRRLLIFSLILVLPMYVFTTLVNQPYLVERGFSVRSLGVIFALITGIGGVVASFTHKVEPYLKQRLSFLLIIILFTATLVLMGIIKSQIVLFVVIGFYIIDNFKNVIIDNYMNLSVSSESRATVLSVQSFINNLFISFLFVFIGHLVDIFSINTVLIAMGLFVGTSSFILWITPNKGRE